MPAGRGKLASLTSRHSRASRGQARVHKYADERRLGERKGIMILYGLLFYAIYRAVRAYRRRRHAVA